MKTSKRERRPERRRCHQPFENEDPSLEKQTRMFVGVPPAVPAAAASLSRSSRTCLAVGARERGRLFSLCVGALEQLSVIGPVA
ncbi:hypothetical protein Trydic_g7025 [Trypoxylus dichotomus]